MQENGQVIDAVEGSIGWITLVNPSRLNAISYSMWGGIEAAITRFEQNPDVRCVVIRGEGARSFSVGADISEFDNVRSDKDANVEYERVATHAMLRLQSTSKPTIAMIRGYCIGGGAALAVCCDLRLAETGARFGIPAAKLGLGYDYPGIKRLVSLVGPSSAKRLFFTASQFPAEEALRIGLLDSITAPDELEATVKALANTIAVNAPMTIAAAKFAVGTATCDHGEQDMEEVFRLVQACFVSEDYAEGRRAFSEKRAPVFKGR